jgi:carboxyl-terminal processing protease
LEENGTPDNHNYFTPKKISQVIMNKNWLKALLALSIIGLLGYSVGTTLRLNRTAEPRSETDYLRLLSQVKSLVKEKYVETVNEKKLMEGAVNGMLASLDPHSVYLPPEFFREMNVEISGSFGGLGIEITISDDKLTVIAPIDDTPAFRAGMKAGDFIWKIDGKPTRGLTIGEAVKRMRGPAGTGVTLSVIRKNSPQPLVFKLVRAVIKIKSVKSRTLEPGYGYVRIAQFQERTGEEFATALEALRKNNGGTLRGLVLDLRNNPGGLLDAAVAVAGRFVDGKAENGLIVATKGRQASANMDLTTGMNNKEPRYPVVVLINGGSASASEIVAGALQDHKRAVIMGTQSFGKGSVQTIFPMRGGAGLKLTTARYYTPKGRSIQAKGITPDIIVESGEVLKPGKKKEFSFHEKDLANHITDGSDEQGGNGEHVVTPEQAKEPHREPAKNPHSKDGKDVRDSQLDRALDLLKGVELFGPTP